MKNSLALFLFSFVLSTLSVGFLQNEVSAQKRPAKNKLKEGPEQPFRIAVAHYKKNELSKAEQILNKITEMYPQYPPAWALMAKMHHEQQDLKGAKKIVYHALKLNPHSRLLNFLAAKILYKENKPLKAMEFMSRANNSSDSDDHEIDDGETNMEEMQKQIASAFSQQTRSKPQFYTSQTNESADWQTQLPAVHNDKKLKIAVLPFQFKAMAGWQDTAFTQTGNVICDMLTTSMVQTNCFLVVERQQLDRVMIEQDFEMGEAIEQSTAVKVGELIGVDAIIVGVLTQLGSQTEIDGRLVNIQSGQIISASNVNYSSLEQLRTAVNSLTVSITQSAYK